MERIDARKLREAQRDTPWKTKPPYLFTRSAELCKHAVRSETLQDEDGAVTRISAVSPHAGDIFEHASQGTMTAGIMDTRFPERRSGSVKESETRPIFGTEDAYDGANEQQRGPKADTSLAERG